LIWDRDGRSSSGPSGAAGSTARWNPSCSTMHF